MYSRHLFFFSYGGLFRWPTPTFWNGCFPEMLWYFVDDTVICLLESLSYSLNRDEAVLKHFFFQEPVFAPVKLMETTVIRIIVTGSSNAQTRLRTNRTVTLSGWNTMRERTSAIGHKMYNVAKVGLKLFLLRDILQRLGPAVERLIPPLHWEIDVQWICVTKTNLAIL